MLRALECSDLAELSFFIRASEWAADLHLSCKNPQEHYQRLPENQIEHNATPVTNAHSQDNG